MTHMTCGCIRTHQTRRSARQTVLQRRCWSHWHVQVEPGFTGRTHELSGTASAVGRTLRTFAVAVVVEPEDTAETCVVSTGVAPLITLETLSVCVAIPFETKGAGATLRADGTSFIAGNALSPVLV